MLNLHWGHGDPDNTVIHVFRSYILMRHDISSRIPQILGNLIPFASTILPTHTTSYSSQPHSSDCRTNFDLQAPKESSIYPTNAVPVKVVVGNIRQAAATEAFNASSAALQPIAIEASGVVAYKRVMPVTVSRGDSMDRAMNTHAN